MAGNPRLAEFRTKTQFSATHRPANPGRKPNAIRAYIKENDLSSEDVRATITDLLAKTAVELEAVALDEKAPVLYRGFAMAIMKEMKNAGLDNIEVMITRAFGKPTEFVKQEIDLTATVATMTRDEKIAELKRLQGTARAPAKKPKP